MDVLLLALKQTGVRCFIGWSFVGALAYADDSVLLAPSANAMRRMLSTCNDYGAEYSVVFNTLKSKCLNIYTIHGLKELVSIQCLQSVAERLII